MVRQLKIKRSLKLFAEALKYLPSGTSSNARIMNDICPTYAPCSIFIQRARGAHIWDVDGNKYIDYRLGFGPVILGHSHPSVTRSVHNAEKRGQVYALDSELGINVAKRIGQIVPCAQMVRFANSGTEATMSAIRIARGYTGKDKIVKFEGHYHGSHDYLLFSTDPSFSSPKNKPIPASLGIPHGIDKLVHVEEWNNFETIERTLKENHKEIAAVITEPVMGNAAAIPPRDGYLKHLRELCDKYGVLLIFDEVKTGFRLAPGGAQQLFKVTPDIGCFAKSLGNGYPIAAVAGLRDIMKVVAPGRVFHGGTYSANTVALTAAHATLKALDEKVYTQLRSYGRRLMHGLSEVFEDHNIEHLVQGYPEMFQFVFTRRSHIHNYRDLANVDMGLYGRLHLELLKRGVMIDEDNEEVIFTSYSHSQKDLNTTLSALDDAIPAAKIPRSALRYI